MAQIEEQKLDDGVKLLGQIIDLIWKVISLLTGIEQPGVTPPPIGEPLLDEDGENGWENLVRLIKEDNSRAEHFNIAFLAQCILESGRGASRLAKEHLNYAGLKYRPELKGIAEPVSYDAHDGTDTYCKFKSDADFIKGYWLFIQRKPYKGWELCETAFSYLKHLKNAGYATDERYVEKLIPLCEEAKKLIEGSSYQPPKTEEPKDPQSGKDTSVKGTLVLKRGHTEKAPGASLTGFPGWNEWFYYGKGPKNAYPSFVEYAQNYAFEKYPNVRIVEVLRDGLSISAAYDKRVKAQKPDRTIENHFNATSNKSVKGTETLCSFDSMDKRFAAVVQKKLCEVLKRSQDSRGVKPIPKSQNGGSAVHALPSVPNCLIEPAFGSNSDDAKLLMDKRKEIAEALVEAFVEDMKGS